MLNRLRSRISRLFRADVAKDDFRDRLVEARSKLEQEATDMQRDIVKAGNRVDPIGTIIRNITKVRGSQ